MKQLLIAGVLTAGLLFKAGEPCRAQAVFLTDVNGRVIMSNKYVDVQGSPYLTDDWKNGTVTTTRNQTYKDLKLRYDAYAGELEYEQNDKTYRVNSANVKEFTITDGIPLVFRSGFPAVNNNPATTFYQVLVDGPTKLLKQPKITMSENRAYNSATTVRQFQKQDWYFLVKPDGTAQRIQKSKKSVLAALPDQKEQLEKLIKEKSIDLGEESGLTALVTELNAR